jgi:hypothetical protein
LNLTFQVLRFFLRKESIQKYFSIFVIIPIPSVLKVLATWLLLMLFSVYEKTPQHCDSLIVQGVELMFQKQHEKSLALLVEARTMAEENQWYKQQFLAINNIGANYFTMMDYGEALDNYLEAYTLAIKNLSTDEEMIVLNNIAILYSKDKQYNKAEEYFKKAYDLAKQAGETRKMGMYGVNLGVLNNYKNHSENAKKYLHEALLLLDENSEGFTQAQIALIENAVQRNDLTTAHQVISSLQQTIDSTNLYWPNLMLAISKTYAAQNDFKTAIDFGWQCLSWTTDLDIKLDALELLDQLYQNSGQHLRALPIKDSILATTQTLHTLKNGRLFETNRVKFEIQNYQKELQENQQKLSAQRKKYFILLTFALSAIFLISWALWTSRIKNKQRKIIHQRTQEILALELEKEKNQKLLLQNSIQEKETRALLEQERLKNEIESKNRQLAVKALHLSNRNELVQDLINTLTNLPEVANIHSVKMRIRQLKSHLNNETEWNEFFKHFEEVNQGFLSSLKEKHPVLSANDIRFLSYLYMNLTTKEIASLFNITTEACRKRKERIISKMNLPDNVDLYSYLSTI